MNELSKYIIDNNSRTRSLCYLAHKIDNYFLIYRYNQIEGLEMTTCKKRIVILGAGYAGIFLATSIA